MGEGDTSGMQRYTVRDAADMLGITTGAVRNRLSRGTLRSVKERGTVYVLLPADTPGDTARDADDMPDAPAALMSEMRGRIDDLRSQLEAERRANEENRRIIAALTQRIPEIEAPREVPSEPRASPTEATEQTGRVEPQAQVEGAQEDQEHVSWWRRVFGA